MKAPEIEKSSYGDYHYLASSKMLEKTKGFLRENNIAFIGGDLSDSGFMGRMGDVLRLHDAQVVFADLTNIMGWVGGIRNKEKGKAFLNSLGNLPIQESCPILHSRNIGRAGRSPLISHLSRGLEEYGRNCDELARRSNPLFSF